MITAIQLVFLTLLAYILWCEYSPFFKDTLFSISSRVAIAVVLLAGCYHAESLNKYPYEIRFVVFAFSLLLLLYSVKYILKKYNINKMRYLKAQRKMRGRYEIRQLRDER